MAAVRVPRRVRVVLEEVDDATDALLAEALLGAHQELLEDPLPRLVVGDQVEDRIALRRRVLRMTPHIEVQPRPVRQEHVRRPPPRHHPTEQVPRHLVGTEPSLSAERACHPVLVLETEDAPLHLRNLPSPRPSGGTVGAVRRSGPTQA